MWLPIFNKFYTTTCSFRVSNCSQASPFIWLYDTARSPRRLFRACSCRLYCNLSLAYISMSFVPNAGYTFEMYPDQSEWAHAPHLNVRVHFKALLICPICLKLVPQAWHILMSPLTSTSYYRREARACRGSAECSTSRGRLPSFCERLAPVVSVIPSYLGETHLHNTLQAATRACGRRC
jgi:hypothetical protein